MKAEVVAVWLFEAADEATKDSPLRAEPKGHPAELWATLTPEQQAIAMAFARRAYTAGLRCAQELAKKHVYAWGDEVDAEQGLCADIGVSFAAFDNAIEAEVAKRAAGAR